jgi:hypothetical protein
MGYDHFDAEIHQLGCELGEALESALGPPIVDDNVLVLLVSESAKAGSQGVNSGLPLRVRRHAEKADLVDLRGWLRARRERPRRGRAADERDELAPLHSITSFARATNTSDKETPSDAAVLRLTPM